MGASVCVCVYKFDNLQIHDKSSDNCDFIKMATERSASNADTSHRRFSLPVGIRTPLLMIQSTSERNTNPDLHVIVGTVYCDDLDHWYSTWGPRTTGGT
uniref:(California timema) hypothetical protein n=1 Tax=Timema californicum TaxID=61474 RepID=A0A7R9J3J3_TIMCA|nr:unnamed protein product [Timema californicum]